MVTTATYSSWFAYRKSNPSARLRLFCFPYAGGGASIFRAWSDCLPKEIEVCPVQLPGRENRLGDSLFTRLIPLAEVIAENLLPLLDKPYAFIGHSFGALLAFELARQLKEKGHVGLVHLFVSACRASHIAYEGRSVFKLSDEQLLKELIDLNGTPKEVLLNPEVMELMIPIFRADFSAIETYICPETDSLDCPTTAFGGFQDEEVSYAELEAWRDQTIHSFKLRMFAGDHFFLNRFQRPILKAHRGSEWVN